MAVVVGQFGELARGGIGESLLAESERCAPQPRHPVEKSAVLVVEYVDAFSPRDDGCAVPLVMLKVGVPMKHIGHVTGME